MSFSLRKGGKGGQEWEMDLQGKADNDDVTVGDVPMFAK